MSQTLVVESQLPLTNIEGFEKVTARLMTSSECPSKVLIGSLLCCKDHNLHEKSPDADNNSIEVRNSHLEM